ncbi:hypothetical protein [Coleofasciculus sp.]|uniref:hypothetical protein n=1 Tax=Coleofasciculus sp. TaxID=3100458 RepID=UPI003A1D2092
MRSALRYRVWVGLREESAIRVKVRLRGTSAISFACAEGNRVWVRLKGKSAIRDRL